MQKLELKDIKGIVEVSDHSFWWLMALVLLLVVMALVAGWFLKKRLRKKRRFLKTPLEIAKEKIEAIDYSDPKSVAYTFIEEVEKFVNAQNREAFEAIKKALEPYKYQKEVPSMDEALKERIKKFIKEIKWHR